MHTNCFTYVLNASEHWTTILIEHGKSVEADVCGMGWDRKEDRREVMN